MKAAAAALLSAALAAGLTWRAARRGHPPATEPAVGLWSPAARAAGAGLGLAAPERAPGAGPEALPRAQAEAWCARGGGSWNARARCRSWRLYERYFDGLVLGLPGDFAALAARLELAEESSPAAQEAKRSFARAYAGPARDWPAVFGWALQAVEGHGGRARLSAAPSPSFSRARAEAGAAGALEDPPAGMALVPGGRFEMGSAAGAPSERPRHAVVVDAFFLDRHEVTVGEYSACVEARRCAPRGTSPDGPYCAGSGRAQASLPANCVNWDMAFAYCSWAGKRLPTEAEWERAALAGATGRFAHGDDPRQAHAYGWDYSNAGGGVRPVMTRAPNAFGLFDMAGNVWEWVADRFDPGYYAVSPARNPAGPSSADLRIVRGGSWLYPPAPASLRMDMRQEVPSYGFGFRCAAAAPFAQGPRNK